ncbi:thioredoxin-like protein [Russula earlei]|uniref:Thioredoxin-like protein n=1 Tax=Russula earlei TaxID=71964 RepID=A0ACC0TR40_9AGAM|nr:thioredoxin-like protein [Russula earlei]
MGAYVTAQPPQQQPPHKRPPIEQRIKRLNDSLSKSLPVTAAQKKTIDDAYTVFFTQADKITGDNPPPRPDATDEKSKQMHEQLRKAVNTTVVYNNLPYYNSEDFTPLWVNNTDSLKYLHAIRHFSFTDQDGAVITSETVANKIYVADFFFTSCPGICKKLTTNLLAVQKEFMNDANVSILSHSVTPDIDSVARLKQYAGDFGIVSTKWHLLTGNKDSIYTIARKDYFADEDLGVQKDVNDFLHTENVLLIDKHKRIRGVYKGTSPLEIKNLVTDIHLLEQE